MSNKYAHLRPSRSESDRVARFRKSAIERYRMCTSKVGRTEVDAERAAKAKGLRAYACPWCSQWHLTSRKAESA